MPYIQAPYIIAEVENGDVLVVGRNSGGRIGTEFLGCISGELTSTWINLGINSPKIIATGQDATFIQKSDNTLWATGGSSQNGAIFSTQSYLQEFTETTVSKFWEEDIGENIKSIQVRNSSTMLTTTSGHIYCAGSLLHNAFSGLSKTERPDIGTNVLKLDSTYSLGAIAPSSFNAVLIGSDNKYYDMVYLQQGTLSF